MESDDASQNESDNFSSDGDCEFDEFQRNTSSDYDPDGVLSNNDAQGCCHWSNIG